MGEFIIRKFAGAITCACGAYMMGMDPIGAAGVGILGLGLSIIFEKLA